MTKFMLIFIALTLITGCSSTKLTPDQVDEMHRHAEHIRNMRF